MAEEHKKSCSYYFHVLVPAFSLIVYYADLISDIVLAVQYYRQGHKSWAVLTAMFILFPVPVYIALTTYMACVSKNYKSLQMIIMMILCFPLMLIINSLGLYSYLAETLQHKKSDTKFQAKRLATMNQVFEALLEASPQCILQLYIILIDETTADRSDISIGRYVAIATSAIAISWNFFCHEKMMYILCEVEEPRPQYRCAIRPVVEPTRLRDLYTNPRTDEIEPDTEEDLYNMPVVCQICLLVQKICECVQRVLAIALFLSFVQFRVPFIFIILFHIVLLTLIDCYMLHVVEDDDSICKQISKSLSAAILRVICYTSTNNLPNNIIRVFSHFILASIENWVFVGLWFHLRPDRHEWLFKPVLVVFISMFVIQTCLQLLYYLKLDNHQDHEDMNNVMSVFFDIDANIDDDDDAVGVVPGQAIIMRSVEGVK